MAGLRGYGDIKSVTSAHSEGGLHSSTAANPQRADGLVTLARDRREEVDPRNQNQQVTHHIDFESIDQCEIHLIPRDLMHDA